MRLYEFTDPTDYTLCADDAEESIEQVERNGKADETAPHPKNKPETGKMKLLDKR